MKIQLIQSEIEEGLRQYIQNQIAVREGHEIIMDFTNTRGPEGLTANISIEPSKVPAKQTMTSRPRPTVETRSVVQDTVPQAEPVVEEAAEEIQEESKDTSPFQPSTNATYNSSPSEDNDAEDGTKPLRRSIFSGMTRPSNSDEAAA